MNNEFSIILPYHAIPETIDFVKRQLNYYHFNQTPMSVILAVSGDKMVNVELKQFIEKLNDSRFMMLTTDESNITNYQSFVNKIYNALQTVTTPYVVINGADDVIIPEAVCKGTEILSNHLDIAAVKGYTICFDCESGKFLICNYQEILDNSPLDRVRQLMKDYDSMFYIIRRTKELVGEYENIMILLEKSNIFYNSPYHIEHFKALSAVFLGKIYVFKSPWRLFNRHRNNHSSHTEAGFLRIKLGVLDKNNYEWFQSVTKNMSGLSYSYYRFLWVLHQIRGISVTLKQIAYHYLYKKCSFIASLRIFTYFILNKIFILFKKIFSNRLSVLQDEGNFFKSKHYELLKKHYFSEENIKLIEANERVVSGV